LIINQYWVHYILKIFFWSHNIYLRKFFLFMTWKILISKIIILLKYKIIYSNLQRLNMNKIVLIIKYINKFKYIINNLYFFMIKSYIFFHKYENVNNNIKFSCVNWKLSLKSKSNKILPKKKFSINTEFFINYEKNI